MTWRKTINTEVIEVWYNQDIQNALVLTNEYKASGFRRNAKEKYSVKVMKKNNYQLEEFFTTKEDAEKFCSIYRKNHP